MKKLMNSCCNRILNLLTYIQTAKYIPYQNTTSTKNNNNNNKFHKKFTKNPQKI
jgi:hypothetical protein